MSTTTDVRPEQQDFDAIVLDWADGDTKLWLAVGPNTSIESLNPALTGKADWINYSNGDQMLRCALGLLDYRASACGRDLSAILIVVQNADDVFTVANAADWLRLITDGPVHGIGVITRATTNSIGAYADSEALREAARAATAVKTEADTDEAFDPASGEVFLAANAPKWLRHVMADRLRKAIS